MDQGYCKDCIYFAEDKEYIICTKYKMIVMEVTSCKSFERKIKQILVHRKKKAKSE